MSTFDGFVWKFTVTKSLSVDLKHILDWKGVITGLELLNHGEMKNGWTNCILIRGYGLNYEIVKYHEIQGCTHLSPPYLVDNMGLIADIKVSQNSNVDDIYYLSSNNLAMYSYGITRSTIGSIAYDPSIGDPKSLWSISIGNEFATVELLGVGFPNGTGVYALENSALKDYSSQLSIIIDQPTIAMLSIIESHCIVQVCEKSVTVLKILVEDGYIECLNGYCF